MGRTSTSAMWAWIRYDLRNRRRSLAVLGLLVALTTGVVLTAVAGARRGDSAVDRMVARTLPATVAALPNQPGFDWEAVADLPGVEAIGRFPVSSFLIDDLGSEGTDFAYGDEATIAVERPVVIEGRHADPSRDDEAVVTAAFEGTYGKGVGDTVTVRLYAPEQVDGFFTTGEEPDEPAGPTIETTIVGVVRSLWFADTPDAPGGRLIPSNGLFEQHAPNLVGSGEHVSVNALVRLEGGAAAVPGFREDLAELTGRRDIEFFDLAAGTQHLRDVAGFEANALLAFAGAALIAAIFLIGQSVVRYVGAARQDMEVLSAVGMPPAHVRLAAAAGPSLAAAVGAVVGVGAAIAASSRFPTGTASALEAAPGRRVDLLVLSAGVVLIPLLVAAGALAASWSAARSGEARSRRSDVAGLAARAGAPIPITLGASFALDRGRGAQAVPVLPALLGAVVGVLGVVAALTFADGVDDAIAHPERFGQTADLQAYFGFNGEDFLPSEAPLAAMAADPDVLAVNDTRQGVLESGVVDVAAFAIDPVGEPPPVVLLEGRLATAKGEVTIAPKSAADLRAEVGDRIELSGSQSSGRYEVTGIAFVPEGRHNGYDEGAWVTAETYDELIDGFKFHTAELTVRPGADVGAVQARVGAAIAESIGAPPEAAAELLGPPTPPARLGELREVRRLPLLLAGFLSVLAVAAVGHAVATAVRRRRHDLAVLRAVGLTQVQSWVTIFVQATILALVGLSVGVPLGFALGRTLWGSVADSTPVDYVPPVAIWALVLIAPVALVAANLLAAWPARRAASLRVAHVLRTE